MGSAVNRKLLILWLERRFPGREKGYELHNHTVQRNISFQCNRASKTWGGGGRHVSCGIGNTPPRASPGILQVNHEQKDKKVRPPEVQINQVKPERGEWVSEMDEEVGGGGGGPGWVGAWNGPG